MANCCLLIIFANSLGAQPNPARQNHAMSECFEKKPAENYQEQQNFDILLFTSLLEYIKTTSKTTASIFNDKKSSWYALCNETQYSLCELFGTNTHTQSHAMSSIIPRFWLGLLLYIPANSYGHVGIPHFFLGKLEQVVNQYFVHII